jgi:pyruvate formate lyase activating enzyme
MRNRKNINMKIGGFVKQSLIDYPGKIAAIVFTQGCNFRCGYCHNPRLVLPELFPQGQHISPQEVLTYLEERKNWLDGVVVTGGEPTIHNDLAEFLKTIKDMGYQVKLDTNGSNPYMLEQIVKEKLADYIAMDIKIPLEDGLYAKIIGVADVGEITENILASVMILKNTTIDGEFRTTSIPGIHNEAMITLIKKYIGNDKRYKINEFRDGEIIGLYHGNITKLTS